MPALRVLFFVGLSAFSVGEPLLSFSHPHHDNATVVTVGSRVLIDMNVKDWRNGQDGQICLDTQQLSCYDTPDDLAIVLPHVGTFTLGAHIVAAARNAEESRDEASLRASIVASTSVSVQAVAKEECTGRFGRAPCDAGRPPAAHCASLPRFRFYLYPTERVATTQAAQLYYALRDSPLRTDDPREACVFVPLIDPVTANTPGEPLLSSSRRLTRAPYYGAAGEYHLLFHFGDYEPGFDVGRAILAKSSFGPPLPAAEINPSNPDSVIKMSQRRVGYDIVAPLPFYRCGYADDAHLTRFTAAVAQGRVRPASQRAVLASFKGALYDLPPSHFASVRNVLPALHDGADVIIATTCWHVAPKCGCPVGSPDCGSLNVTTSRAHACAGAQAYAGGIDYDALMLNSRFVFVAPGEGTHSYRLYEALQAGAIPILLGESAAPLPELIHWPDLAIIQLDTSLSALQALVALLRTLPPARLDAMQAAGRIVFDNNLRDLPSQLQSVFGALSLRFMAAQTALERERKAAEEVTSGITSDERTSTTLLEQTASKMGVDAADGSAQALGQSDAAASAVGRLDSLPSNASSAALLASAQRLAGRLNELVGRHAAEVRRRTSAAQEEEMAQGGDQTHTPEAELLAGAALTTRVEVSALRELIQTLLRWLNRVLAEPRALEESRKDALWVLTTLSQVYSLAGHWRAAVTAAQAKVVLFPFDSASAAQSGVDFSEAAVNQLTLRARNAVYDSRRPPHVLTEDERTTVLARGYVAPATVSDGQGGVVTAGRLYRSTEALHDSDDEVMAGYGALAHFLTPASLAPLDEPGSALLPLAPLYLAADADRLRAAAHPDAILPQVAVDESTLHAVAAALAPRGQPPLLSTDLRSFLAQLSRALARDYYLPKGTDEISATGLVAAPRVAVASLCIYNSSETALGRLSTANLQRYCERHGYDCFVSTRPEAADERRPTAWSKLLLVAQYLPSYDWVMWRDCDSFVMDHSLRVEHVVAAAGAARGVIATATASVLEKLDGLPPSSGTKTVESDDASPASALLPSRPPMDLIISEDGLMLNSGVFLVRNSAWARGFLRRVYGVVGDAAIDGEEGSETRPVDVGLGNVEITHAQRPPPVEPVAAVEAGSAAVRLMRDAPLPFATNRAWEQASIFALLALAQDLSSGRPGAPPGEGGSTTPRLTAYRDAARVQVVPQAWLNAYPAELAGQMWDHHQRPMHAVYRHAEPAPAPGPPGSADADAGDYILSFSGCGVLLGKERCEDLYSTLK